jgi:hypothetical protein
MQRRRENTRLSSGLVLVMNGHTYSIRAWWDTAAGRWMPWRAVGLGYRSGPHRTALAAYRALRRHCG